MDPPGETEAELEAFRQQWRQEVSQRNKKLESTSDETRPSYKEQRRRSIARKKAALAAGPSSTARRKEAADGSDEIEPKVYHDLPDKEEHLKLGEASGEHDRTKYKEIEPRSALEHYEQAVEKETQGSLGDSLNLYRKAFKLDDRVHETYKNKHFPPSSFKPKPVNPNPSIAAVTVPNTAHHSLHGSSLPPSLAQLLQDYSTLAITPALPPTDASPQEPCKLAELPEEILTEILKNAAIADVASFARLAQVCKRLAYLVLTEEGIWKRVALGAEFGFGAMHYDYVCDLEGFPLEANDSIARYLNSYDSDEQPALDLLPPTNPTRSLITSTKALLHAHYASSYRQLFRSRPRLRFNGCYISTVNYTRPGATSTNTLTWGTPIHVVTYFRYLRFFRDGTVISLLTTSEPADVVHHLTKPNLHSHHGLLPSAVMKDALRGRWRLSGPWVEGGSEEEGDVHVETDGVVPKYMWKMQFALGHAGRGARNNKLSWKGFWSYNRLTDDWGEFGLKNDRAFYWSRVKSFGMGW